MIRSTNAFVGKLKSGNASRLPQKLNSLALYGAGGSISEVLKDRNGGQLKDKARNLKGRYLKTGEDVPQALKGVTGDLKRIFRVRARAAFGTTDRHKQSGGDVIEVGVDKSQTARKRKKTKKAS